MFVLSGRTTSLGAAFGTDHSRSATSPRLDDPVVILRNGHEVGGGTVMRLSGSQCSIRVVVLRRASAAGSSRRSRTGANAGVYFNSFSTGEYLLKP